MTIVSPDAQGRIDPPVMRLLQLLPRNGPQVTVVPITRLENFIFGAPKISGPWVLVDFTEFGWDWDQKTSYLWGADRLTHQWFHSPEWKKMEEWIMANPPLLTFQRELLASDVSDRVLPIDYPNYSEKTEPQSAGHFHSRPVDVMFNWGLSSNFRPYLHGEIFKGSTRLEYEVCSQWDHLDAAIQKKTKSLWASIHTPYYSRIDNQMMIRRYSDAKIAIAAPGCGRKTFRHGEIHNSAIAMQSDRLAYSVNMKGIRLEEGREVDSLWSALSSPGELYEVYLMNNAASDKLRPERYISEFLIPKIQEKL